MFDKLFDELPQHEIRRLYDEGKLIFYVDRGLATKFAGQGMPISGIAAILGYGFPLLLVGGTICAIFYSMWIGIFLIVGAFISYRLARLRLVKEVRELALADQEWFDLLRKGRVIWFDKAQ